MNAYTLRQLKIIANENYGHEAIRQAALVRWFDEAQTAMCFRVDDIRMDDDFKHAELVISYPPITPDGERQGVLLRLSYGKLRGAPGWYPKAVLEAV